MDDGVNEGGRDQKEWGIWDLSSRAWPLCQGNGEPLKDVMQRGEMIQSALQESHWLLCTDWTMVE